MASHTIQAGETVPYPAKIIKSPTPTKVVTWCILTMGHGAFIHIMLIAPKLSACLILLYHRTMQESLKCTIYMYVSCMYPASMERQMLRVNLMSNIKREWQNRRTTSVFFKLPPCACVLHYQRSLHHSAHTLLLIQKNTGYASSWPVISIGCQRGSCTGIARESIY